MEPSADELNPSGWEESFTEIGRTESTKLHHQKNFREELKKVPSPITLIARKKVLRAQKNCRLTLMSYAIASKHVYVLFNVLWDIGTDKTVKRELIFFARA